MRSPCEGVEAVDSCAFHLFSEICLVEIFGKETWGPIWGMLHSPLILAHGHPFALYLRYIYIQLLAEKVHGIHILDSPCHHPIQMWLIRANEAAGDKRRFSHVLKVSKKKQTGVLPLRLLFSLYSYNASLKYILRKILVAILESIFPATSKVRKCTFFHPQFYFWKFTFSLLCNDAMQSRQLPMDGGDFLNESIYIYVLQKEKWGKLVHQFSMPSFVGVFLLAIHQMLGETMPVRCTCGRGGCFGLYRYLNFIWAASRTCFFNVWSSNTWHILTNGGRKSQKLQKKKYREATALTLPLSSPLRPARGITNHGLPGYKLYFPGSLRSIYRITQIQHDETRIDINMFHRDCSDISYCCNDINFGVTSTGPLATRSKGGGIMVYLLQ